MLTWFNDHSPRVGLTGEDHETLYASKEQDRSDEDKSSRRYAFVAVAGVVLAPMGSIAYLGVGVGRVRLGPLSTARYQTISGRQDGAGLARELERFGVYDLPCGGGFITDPGKASRWLWLGYGREGAASRCLNLLSQGPLASDQDKLRVALACDVLYRLPTKLRLVDATKQWSYGKYRIT